MENSNSLDKLKTPSKQVRWQRAKKAEGLCVYCGNPATRSTRCDLCAHKGKLRARRLYNCKAWKPGGPGRPPIYKDPTTP